MDKDSKGHNYSLFTTWENLVAKYTGLNFLQIEELDYIDYLIYRRDAFIHKMSQTEEGVKYLKNAYRLQETKPDRESLRKKYGK